MKRLALVVALVGMSSVANSAYIYTCKSAREQLQFSNSSFVGEPYLNYKSEDAEFHLSGSDMNLNRDADVGFSVFAEVDHREIATMSAFFPLPSQLASPVLVAVKFTDHYGMPKRGEAMVCEVMKVWF